MKKHLLSFVLSLVLSSCIINSYSSEYSITNFDTNSTSGGLQNNSVMAIAQDNSGNMWFGYSGNAPGLTKFDGSTWTTYTSSDGLIGDNVADIAVHPDGTLWIATNAGVSAFDGSSFTNYTTSDGLLGTNVMSVEIDFNGHIWFGFSNGISVFDGNTSWTTITDYGLPQTGGYILTMSADNDGKMWISAMDGVAFWDGSVWTGYPNATTGNLLPNIYSITADTAGGIWFACSDYTDGGISKLETTGTWTRYISAFADTLGELYGIDADGFGNIWVGQFMTGLWAHDGYNWTLYSTSNGLISNDLSNVIYVDNENNVWAATMSGISKLSPTMSVYTFYEEYVSCGACDGILTVDITGGQAPYDYVLTQDSTVASQGSVSSYDNITNLCAGSYDLEITDATGLLNWQGNAVLETASAYIIGTAMLNASPIMDMMGSAELYKVNSGGVSHTLIERATLSYSGDYYFYDLEEGQYILKIVKDSMDYMYQNVLSTYYNGVVGNNQATAINLSCGQEITGLDVNMYEVTPMPAGNICLAGTITYIPYGEKSINAVGDPVPGAEVYIEQEPNDDPVAQDVTDTLGNFSIDNLYDSIYTITVDIPGVDMVSSYENINLNDTDSVFADLNFYVDTLYGLGISIDSTRTI